MFHEPRFWISLAFILFFVIFGRKLWMVIATALDERATLVKNRLDEATRLRREAEQMLEDATREREKAQAEARRLIAESEAEAVALKEQALRDAAEVTTQHEKMARERIEAAEQAVLRDIRDKATALAITASRHVIAETLERDPAQAQRLMDQSLDRLPQALSSHRTA